MSVNETSPTRVTRGRHTIEIRAGELAEAVDMAEAALLAADAGIYQRGGQLVRVVPFFALVVTGVLVIQ